MEEVVDQLNGRSSWLAVMEEVVDQLQMEEVVDQLWWKK